jgi:hypothetical protein
LEAQTVIVNHLVVGQVQITAEQDGMRPSFGFQVGLEQDDHVQWFWELSMKQLQLLSAGFDAVFDQGCLEIRIRDSPPLAEWSNDVRKFDG